jgi:hypothetical protein
VHWGQIDTEGLFMGLFVGGLCGWNLVAAYANVSIGTRSGSVSRKKSPELFWFVTAICAFVFGIIGVGVLLIGLGAPTIFRAGCCHCGCGHRYNSAPFVGGWFAEVHLESTTRRP